MRSLNFKVDSMAGKGTREGIFNFRMICERYSEVNQDVYACFIDCEKAFRPGLIMKKMIKCLNDIGIKGKDLKMIVNLYCTQRAPIRLEESLSDEIWNKRGVRQGCELSLCLFALHTETIFWHIEDSKGVTIGETRINNLWYADDTVLLADSEGNLQNLMKKVNEVGKLYNMKINAKKTKAMVISRNENKPNVDITAVEQVGGFNYLGLNSEWWWKMCR